MFPVWEMGARDARRFHTNSRLAPTVVGERLSHERPSDRSARRRQCRDGRGRGCCGTHRRGPRAIATVISARSRCRAALITILAAAWSPGRRSGSGEDEARRVDGHRPGVVGAAHPVHAGPDAVRHPGFRGARAGSGRARSFRFIKGPVFAQLLMADEINRASPRTQSALLQAMQERHVTVAGQRHDLPEPFPRAGDAEPGLNRRAPTRCPRHSWTGSCCRSDVRLSRSQSPSAGSCSKRPEPRRARAVPVLDAQELIGLQRLVRRVPVGDSVVEAILDLVRAARPVSGVGKHADQISPGVPVRGRARPSC